MKIVTERDTLSPEQLHTITDLELMRADGWEAIEDMGPSELDALEQQVEDSYASHTTNALSHDNTLRGQALQQIRNRRIAINMEAAEASRRAQRRVNMVRDMLDSLSSYADRDLISQLAEVNGSLWNVDIPKEPPALPADLTAATDEELDLMLSTWERYAESLPTERTIERMERDAIALMLLHDERARTLAKGVSSAARAAQKGSADSQKALSRLKEDRQRRERLREEQAEQARQYAANLPAIVSQLEARIKELESR